MVSITTTVVLLACLLAGAQPFPVHAETKVITVDASYIMGDGETPDFAEARALQKAKQTALEEAGTYVQSYTKVQNLDLTTEEIQTIAGGVLQVEVLEKTRSLVSDGLRFYTKIKATVTTEKMDELARRIKGKNVAEEYQKLQTEYARLSRELESWKQRAAKTPQGPERNATLDQIREGEKTFARVQQREADLFQRLVSGKQLIAQATYDKDILDELLKTIIDNGFRATVGEVQAVVTPEKLNLKVPITIRLTETLHEAASRTAKALGGTVESEVKVTTARNSLRIGTETRREAKVTLVRMGKSPETAKYFQDWVERLALLVKFSSDTSEPTNENTAYCLLGPEFWHFSTIGEYKLIPYADRISTDYFPLRRIFPVFSGRGYTPIFDDTFREVSSNDPFWSPDRKHSPSGYVAIVQDEAAFVVKHRLPTYLVRKLTGVSVSVVLVPAYVGDGANEDRDAVWKFTRLYGGAPQCTIEP